MIFNYDKVYQEICKSLEKIGKKPSLLLHSCCAPCSSACLERVTKNFETDVFYYNPNITDSEEYAKRLKEQIDFVKKVYGDSVKVIEGCYNPQEFYAVAKGYENLKERDIRCKICYELRLDACATTALDKGYEYFTTTLTLSPYKNAEWLNEIGKSLEQKYGVNYLISDFKKQDGYKKSIELSKKYGLYRQDYCGCEFSKINR